MKRDQIRLALLAVRQDQRMVTHEVECLLRAGGLEPSQLDVINVLQEVPTLATLAPYHGVLIGGTGDYSVSTHRHELWYAPLRQLAIDLLESGKPLLGLCYGFHLMADAVGGDVQKRVDLGESGTFGVELTEEGRRDILFAGMPPAFEAQQGHNDVVLSVPSPYVRLASSERCYWQGFRHPDVPFYGLQFHPELGRDDLLLRMRSYSSAYASTPERYKEIEDAIRPTCAEPVIRQFVDGVVIPLHVARAQG